MSVPYVKTVSASPLSTLQHTRPTSSSTARRRQNPSEYTLRVLAHPDSRKQIAKKSPYMDCSYLPCDTTSISKSYNFMSCMIWALKSCHVISENNEELNLSYTGGMKLVEENPNRCEIFENMRTWKKVKQNQGYRVEPSKGFFSRFSFLWQFVGKRDELECEKPNWKLGGTTTISFVSFLYSWKLYLQ